MDACIRGGHWTCLAFDPSFLFAEITAVLYVAESATFFVAGQPRLNSSWGFIGNLKYTVARLVLKSEIEHQNDDDDNDSKGDKSVPSDGLHVWEWLSNFDGANGEILSLYFTPWNNDQTSDSSSSKSKSKKSNKSRRRMSLRRQLEVDSGVRSALDDDYYNQSHASSSSSGSDTVSMEGASDNIPNQYGDLLIAGAFTNYPAVAVWVNRPNGQTFTQPVVTDANPVVPGSGVGGIVGHVNTITPMILPIQQKPKVYELKLKKGFYLCVICN